MKVPIFPYLELNTNILGVKNWREKPWRDKKYDIVIRFELVVDQWVIN